MSVCEYEGVGDMSWCHLPAVVLDKILSHLDEPRDRLAFSEVWGVSRRAERLRLWVGDAVPWPRDLKGLKRVTIGCWGEEEGGGARLLSALASHRPPIRALRLTGPAHGPANRPAHSPIRRRTLLALAKLVRVCEKLEELVVEAGADLRGRELWYLANCARRGRLRVLEARGGSGSGASPLKALSAHAPSLASLALDSSSLSPPVLRVLASSAPSLARLRLTLGPSPPQPLPSNLWDALHSSLPDLYLLLEINWVRSEEVVEFLKPRMRVRGLHLNFKSIWGAIEAAQVRQTLDYIRETYAPTLEDVRISLKSTEYIDDFLVTLVTKCEKLTLFRFEGVIRDPWTIGSLLETIEKHHQKRFKYIEMSPRYLTSSGREAIRAAVRRFEKTFLTQSVDFRLVEPSRILFYF